MTTTTSPSSSSSLSSLFVSHSHSKLNPNFHFHIHIHKSRTSLLPKSFILHRSFKLSPIHSNSSKLRIMIKPISWMSFFLLLVTGAGFVYYYKEKKRHIEEISNSSNAVREGPFVGQAAIGGPFNLINHEGKKVTEKDFLGNWTVFYFGFTHCPDICPDELQKLAAEGYKIKQKSGIEIVPVFISVDPERDIVEQVKEYVQVWFNRTM